MPYSFNNPQDKKGLLDSDGLEEESEYFSEPDMEVDFSDEVEENLFDADCICRKNTRDVCVCHNVGDLLSIDGSVHYVPVDPDKVIFNGSNPLDILIQKENIQLTKQQEKKKTVADRRFKQFLIEDKKKIFFKKDRFFQEDSWESIPKFLSTKRSLAIR